MTFPKTDRESSTFWPWVTSVDPGSSGIARATIARPCKREHGVCTPYIVVWFIASSVLLPVVLVNPFVQSNHPVASPSLSLKQLAKWSWKIVSAD